MVPEPSASTACSKKARFFSAPFGLGDVKLFAPSALSLGFYPKRISPRSTACFNHTWILPASQANHTWILCLHSGHCRVLISTVEIAVVHFIMSKKSTKCQPAVSQEEKAHGSTHLDRLREDSSMIQTRKTKIVSRQEHEHKSQRRK